jgi:type VI secretion system protein ImpG
MRDELLTYYERELTFVRRMAAGFAQKYPKIAGRLLFEPQNGKSEDPHVERLIESFAFLASRIHLKIDDEFPEITQSVLQILYPHYLAPIPSMSIVSFTLDPEQGKLSTGYTIERHRRLDSKSNRDATCKFRTCYPVTLWPLDLEAARIDVPGPADVSGTPAPAALVLTLRAHRDIRLSELRIEHLRFFLNAESQLVHRLYELIFGHCTGVQLHRPGGPPVPLGPSALSEVGFGKDEGMLPYSNRSFLGYRLLQEYFHFPEKFWFFDVNNLSALRSGGFDTEASLVLLLDEPPRLDQKIEPKHFRLACTPIVNLFQQSAEPIRLDHAHTEYRVVADLRHQQTTEIYAVDGVTSVSPSTSQVTAFQPFYSFKHSFERRKQHTFWHATRRPSTRKDDAGTEVFLTLVDLDFRPTRPATDVITVAVTCCNRDAPDSLTLDPDGDFDLLEAAPIRRINALVRPTRTVRPPLRHGAQWRLISHLSLNFLSPVEGGDDDDPEVLQEILKLYDFSDSSAVQQQIQGLVGVKSRQVWRRIHTGRGSGFARGIESTLEFDEARYVGTGVYLFASVLEKFLGLYVSINAFSEMIATTTRRVQAALPPLKRWPPRSGQQPLL